MRNIVLKSLLVGSAVALASCGEADQVPEPTVADEPIPAPEDIAPDTEPEPLEPNPVLETHESTD